MKPHDLAVRRWVEQPAKSDRGRRWTAAQDNRVSISAAPEATPRSGGTGAVLKKRRKGGSPVKFARTIGGLAAVVSVTITLALSCERFAALLDAALMI